MITGLSTSSAEEEEILAKFKTWSDKFKKILTLNGMNGLVDEYAQLVSSVETQTCQHGPNGTILTGEKYFECCGVSYEYLNDISVRTAIEMIIEMISEPERVRIIDLIQPIDYRLKSILAKNEKVFRTTEIKGMSREKYWWRYKIPATIRE